MSAPAVSHSPAAAPSTAAAPAVASAAPHGLVDRVRAAVAAVGAAVLGAAPHVLHHVGPLAGAALLAGATGKLLFGALGFALAIPMLRRLRRRTGSWRLPGMALALMAVIFTFSSFVIGPALTGGGDRGREWAAPSNTVPAAPPGVSESDHESHHR
jgi:hypothetical protein